MAEDAMLQNIFKKKNFLNIICRSDEYNNKFNKEKLTADEKKAKNIHLKAQLAIKKAIVAENLSMMWSNILEGKKDIPDKQRVAR